MKKPKDTNSFKYYNANTKGKHTTDCAIRAISIALGQDYKETIKEMIDLWLETGYEYSDPKCIGKYLERKGWVKNKQPKKSDNKKYTGKEFVRIFKGICIANIGGHHMVCIKNGKVLDIWDSTDGCIGNYWTKG